MSVEESLIEDDEDGAAEEQLLYHRVPSFDRALAELCSPSPVVDASSSCRDDNNNAVMENANHQKDPGVVIATSSSSPVQQLPDGGVVVAGFGPTDAELREFAADMEALLGQGLEHSAELDESFYMESLGLMTPPLGEDDDDGGRVKPEPDGAVVSINNREFGHAADTMMKSEEASSVEMNKATASNEVADAQFFRRSLDLRLNYEAVIDSWGTSPWTDGQRPEVRLDDFFWPHNANHSGLWPAGGGRPCSGGPLLTPRWGADGGREARVSRYREKRRTRLFAKKIRYEVRKLNAEKRPRMKGRFVKRSAAAAPCGVT
ncbi:hypothetical protein QOZ80_2BG0199900 [Eleusine coracana subsp. coracana]|nr:hypothetical protein QOZ80_2BG0199900 [Eleusine coracana subsp. coracana]